MIVKCAKPSKNKKVTILFLLQFLPPALDIEIIYDIIIIYDFNGGAEVQNKVDTIINPIRLRIIQYTAQNQPVTVAQISKALPDISKATLYRHMRVLTENEILHVVGQEKTRGTFEQSYSLNMERVASSEQDSSSEVQTLVYSMLLKLVEDFRQYFNSEDSNPIKDKLFMSTNTLYLEDGVFEEFIKEVYDVVEKYSRIPAVENGEMRMISIVSSPAVKESIEEE